MKTDWNILCIGNSFSDDTMEHAANILRSLGVKEISLGNLYIGGCSIHRHVDNAANDRAWYEYRQNHGDGWQTREGVSMREALTSQRWDVVSIQHGTADGSRNTCAACYDYLPILVSYIRAHCPYQPKVMFNMTWVGESWNSHPEIVAHDGDQVAMFHKIAAIDRDIVTSLVDGISPAGTAVQNARAVGLAPLHRDGYHLSFGLGRFIAGLTFIAAATDLDISKVSWRPDGVSEAGAAKAIEAACAAVKTPFAVTAPSGSMQGFVSDTSAGSANQTTMMSDDTWRTARVYYTLTTGGEYYSFLFGDAIDSTFADGTRSMCNDMCGEWYLADMRVGICTHSSMNEAVTPSSWTAVTFDGTSETAIASNDWRETDPVALSAQAEDVLCIEYRFKGTRLPCHEELWVASFVNDGDGFKPSVACPVPSCVSVKRDAARVGFLGDSITQGIGSTKNSYHHWVAKTATALKDRYACWNLGIGFAGIEDAASNGAWLRKAYENDVIVLCLGVNDLLRGFTAEDVCENVRRTVALLRARGIRVFVQTVPPFEGLGAARDQVNVYLKTSLVCEGVFDNGFMASSDGTPLYGGHPNDEGCALWAERLTAWLKERL